MAKTNNQLLSPGQHEQLQQVKRQLSLLKIMLDTADKKAEAYKNIKSNYDRVQKQVDAIEKALS